MDGVGGEGQMEFDVGGFEPRVVGQGHLHHGESLGIGKQFATLLEWVLGRHYKPHFVKIAILQQGVGNDQVSDVHRVE